MEPIGVKDDLEAGIRNVKRAKTDVRIRKEKEKNWTFICEKKDKLKKIQF